MPKTPKTNTPVSPIPPVPAKYFLLDAHDRFFPLPDGTTVELLAGVKKEVTKEVATALTKSYPYLQLLTE